MDLNLLKQTIGRKLRQARKECDLTQDEVATKLDLTGVAYGSFERGTNLIALNYLIEVSRILQKPISFFPPNYVTPEELNDIRLNPRFQSVEAACRRILAMGFNEGMDSLLLMAEAMAERAERSK